MANGYPFRYRICSRECQQAKQNSVFCIRESQSNHFFKLSPREIFYDDKLLAQFPLEDIRRIAFAAVEEELTAEKQGIKQLQNKYEKQLASD